MTVWLSIVVLLVVTGLVLGQTSIQESNSDCGPAYNAEEVSKRAKITSFPPPKASKDRNAKNVRGLVVLRVILCRTGKVTNIEVIERLPHGVTEKAIEAARRVRFVPAEKDGQQVSQRMIFEYSINPD